MLKFFHAPNPLLLSKTDLYPITYLKGSARTSAIGYIPFSHIYLTSPSQLRYFCDAVNRDNRIFVVGTDGESEILSHQRSPVNLGFKKEGLASILNSSGLDKSRSIEIAIVNGMGRSYDENIVGLGALQHFYAYLKTKFNSVKIDLLQRDQSIQGILYERYEQVNETRQLPITVTQFFHYNAYVDLADLVSFEGYGKTPLFDFFLQAFSMQKKVILKRNKRTKLKIIDPDKITRLRDEICARGCLGERRLVFFHPVASTALKSMPVDVADRLVEYLLWQSNLLVVTVVPLASEDPRIIDVSDVSDGVNDHISLIAASDAVVTAGSSTYQISGSLGIPTFLIPTVEADVASATLLPSVKVHLPKKVRRFVSDKVAVSDQAEIDHVRPIWDSVKEEDIVEFMKKVLA